jgi:predicted O-linked N-acetylglucosamine transferase (SPINDLY family)
LRLSRGGSLFHRIRLLPTPLSDQRLLQLLRQADMVLDTFPFGASFYFLALAASAGTPVVTMRSGTVMQSSKDELKELRNFLALHRQRLRQQNATAISPIAHHVATQDLPYFPAVSSVAGFYSSIGMAEHFVANSTSDYFILATALASNRSVAYTAV